MEVATGYGLAALGAGLAAYLDLRSFFEERGLTVASLLTCLPAAAFLILNAGLAALLAFLAGTPRGVMIADAVGIEDVWTRGLVIGLSLPAMLRSKLFTFGPGNSIAVGPEIVFERIKTAVLHAVNGHTRNVRLRIVNDYAGRLAGRPEVVEQIGQAVHDWMRPFVTSEALEEIDREFQSYQERFGGHLGSQEHLAKVIGWAIDVCGVRDVRQELKRLSLPGKIAYDPA